MPRAYGGLNIFNLHLLNEVLLLKSCGPSAYKKDRLWIKWVHDYYLKGVDIMHFRVPCSTSWMFSRIIAGRDQLSSYNV